MLDDDGIYTLIQKTKMLENHEKLKILHNKISNPKEMDKVKFKNELQKGIEFGMIKELFVTPKRAKVVNDLYKNSGYLNFPIYIITSLVTDDIGYILKKTYKGVMWEVRYVV